MITRIVVPLDGSQRCMAAVAPGQVLAAQLDVPLRVLSVVDEGRDPAARQEELDSAMHRLGLDDVEVTVVTGSDPAERVLLEVQCDDDALLCMTTHARSVLTELLLGSVARAVVDDMWGPVILAGPRLSVHWDGPIQSLVVCIDQSPESELALDHAIRLGSELGTRLFLINVLPDRLRSQASVVDDGADWVRVPSGMDEVAVEDDSATVAYRAYLQERAERIAADHGLHADWDVVTHPHPATAVIDYADLVPGAMVVTGTHGRSRVERMVLGSFATAVVRGAGCPVMVVAS